MKIIVHYMYDMCKFMPEVTDQNQFSPLKPNIIFEKMCDGMWLPIQIVPE